MTDDILLKKRRVIYMDEESWTDTKQKARLHGLSISEYIRQILVGPVKATPIGQIEPMSAEVTAEIAEAMREVKQTGPLSGGLVTLPDFGVGTTRTPKTRKK